MTIIRTSWLTAACLAVSLFTKAQNHVAAAMEWVSAGTISLVTAGAQPWTTERSSSPGYYSAVNGATYTSYSDINHIDGHVKKYGNESFLFPVGSGTDLRTLQISAPTSLTETYATAWIAGDPNTTADPTFPDAGFHPTGLTYLGPGIQSVANTGQWDWQAISGTGAGLTVTVSVPDMSSFAGSAQHLRLVGWNGAQWVNLSGASGADGLSENSLLSGTMIPGITAVGIGSISFALPLQLNDFIVKNRHCQAEITWTTESEINTSHFEIEKSTDALSFTKMATMTAQGSGNTRYYKYLLPETTGLFYYRLKMIDLDGKHTYSPVRRVFISCENTPSLRIFPNPVVHGAACQLMFNTAYRGKAAVWITGQQGNVLVKLPVMINASSHTIRIPVSNLLPGIYYASLLDINGNELYPALKFIKR